MFDKLQIAENRYNELTQKLSEPDIMSDQNEYRKLMKEHSDLGEIIFKYIEYKNITKTISETKAMLNENLEREMHDMVNEEIREAEAKLFDIKRDLKVLLLPKDPNDDRSVIVEIRGGAGGDEAALFAGVLFRMYTKYAERKHWTSEILDSNPTEIGGFKEVIFSIEAKGAYSKLKYESGVHRVQRVPSTESSGRIHTSTVTVAVLPEAEDVDVNIDPNDIEIDTYRASGAGGQHVNKTDSAIRITHIPSGLVVTCQDQRSQHKNKDKAMSILRARLFEQAQQQQHSDVASERKSQVGTGDRSERIRTYNFPQGRITDHRINLTLYKIEEILNGDLDELFETLITTDQSQRLSTGVDEY